MSLNQSEKQIFGAIFVLLSLVGAINGDTKKSWAPRGALSQEYLRDLKTTRAAEETTRVTRAAVMDTTVYEEATENESRTATTDALGEDSSGTTEEVDSTTVSVVESKADLIQKGVRLLVTGKCDNFSIT